MKRILLVNPNTEETSSPHLGLGYLAGYLEKQGIDVSIYDRTYSTWQDFKAILSEMNPQIVGITCNTLLVTEALYAAKIIKRYNRDTKVIVGGTHPTIMPNEILQEKNIDIAVIGEGEITFHEIVMNKRLEDINGIAYKIENSEVKINPPREYIKDLDNVPFPARRLFPMDRYLKTKKGRTAWALTSPATTIICSRGCPFHCSFCSSNLIFGRKVRYRSPSNIIMELDELKEKYGIRGIQFHDDTMTLNKEWLIELCDLMIDKKLGLEWFCNARIGTVDANLLEKIQSAGCTTITFGVESGSQRVLDQIIKKGITLEAVRETFKLVRRTDLILHSTFMLGSPGETKNEIEQTITFAKELNPDVAHFAITIPFPGTEMFEMASDYGKLNFTSWNDFHFFRSAVFESNEFDIEYMKKALKRAYLSFYLRPSYIIHQLRVTRTMPQFKRKLKGLRLLQNILQT